MTMNPGHDCMATTDDSKVEMNDWSQLPVNAMEEDWSQLPTLLLWMIMERLDFIDNLQLSSVCKNWLSASTSCPRALKSTTAKDALPWIMNQDLYTSKCEFYKVSTKKKYIIDLPDAVGKLTFKSKQGWLLIVGARKNTTPHSFFVLLLNPLTKAKIEMPDVVGEQQPSEGAFSTTLDGSPYFVVLAYRGFAIAPGLTLRIAYPGDKAWREHSYNGMVEVHLSQHGWSLFIHELQAYYVDKKGRALVLDVGGGHVWREVRELGGERDRRELYYFVESGGEMVRIHHKYGCFRSLKFFRLNDSRTEWVELEDKHLEDRSWFLTGHSFSGKERGTRRVYYWANRMEGCRVLGLHIGIHNLVDETSDILLPNLNPGSKTWFDMGF